MGVIFRDDAPWWIQWYATPDGVQTERHAVPTADGFPHEYAYGSQCACDPDVRPVENNVSQLIPMYVHWPLAEEYYDVPLPKEPQMRRRPDDGGQGAIPLAPQPEPPDSPTVIFLFVPKVDQ